MIGPAGRRCIDRSAIPGRAATEEGPCARGGRAPLRGTLEVVGSAVRVECAVSIAMAASAICSGKPTASLCRVQVVRARLRKGSPDA